MLLLYCRVIIKYCQYSHYFNRKKNEPPRGVLLKDALKVLKISFIQSESFHLNGHIIGFRPQTQKLEPPYKTPSNTLAVKGLKWQVAQKDAYSL